MGLFLLMDSTQLMIIRGLRVAFMPSIYLDHHGEVRHKGRGGRERYGN